MRILSKNHLSLVMFVWICLKIFANVGTLCVYFATVVLVETMSALLEPLWFWLKPCLHYWNDPNLWILYNVWYKFMFCPPESSQVPEQQWLELLMPSLQLNLFSSAMNDGWTWKLIALNAVLRSSCVCPAVCRGVVIEHVVNLFDFVIEHVCCIFL